MSKNVWRCRCGKRAEILTDDNFGDCGCSDPVYGPEYFYMSEECAGMLDEMDENYSEALAEIERLNKQLDEFWEHLDYGWAIEPRAELEKIAKESWNPPNPLMVALHYIWKREAKTSEKDALIKQMREALEYALTEAWSTECERLIEAALTAAEREII